jgi:hypothetical protein
MGIKRTTVITARVTRMGHELIDAADLSVAFILRANA